MSRRRWRADFRIGGLGLRGQSERLTKDQSGWRRVGKTTSPQVADRTAPPVFSTPSPSQTGRQQTSPCPGMTSRVQRSFCGLCEELERERSRRVLKSFSLLVRKTGAASWLGD